MGELDEDDPLRYVDYKTIRNTLERGKTLEQNRRSQSGNSVDPGNVQMLNKINNYPRHREESVPTKASEYVLFFYYYFVACKKNCHFCSDICFWTDICNQFN